MSNDEFNKLKEIIVAQTTAERAESRAEEAIKMVVESNKPSNGELAIMIANLTGQVEQGFKGIHERQDRTNGRISKAEDRLGKLENWRWYIIGGASVILFIISILIKKF